jgi:hypothetical protein
LVQVPWLPGTLHAWQVPVQAELQQKPSTQLPLAHWVLIVQEMPVLSTQCPAPSHELDPVQALAGYVSCCAAGTLVQVPTLPLMLQAWQVPPHAELQQTPSTQLPLRHWLDVAQAVPFVDRQLPAPLQALGAVQPGASCWPLTTLEQVPALPGMLQAWQVPLQPVLQQTPSTQLPERHWPAFAQTVPFVYRQVPEPLQALGAVQFGASGWPDGTLEQVPMLPVTLHAWQLPEQAPLQHTLSAQKPLVHSFPALQPTPLVFFCTQVVIRQ